jgi:hypothetical protein
MIPTSLREFKVQGSSSSIPRLEGAEQETRKDGTTPSPGFKGDPHAYGIRCDQALGRDAPVVGELADVECDDDE